MQTLSVHFHLRTPSALALLLCCGVLGWLVAATGSLVIGVGVAGALLAAFAPRPQRAVLLLGIGLLAGSRVFAYLYLPLGGLTLFVTEGTLALVIVLLTLRTVLTGRIRLAGWRRERVLVLLLIIGSVAALRDFDGLNTGRHSVIVLYALFFIFPVAFLKEQRDVSLLVLAFLVVSGAKVLMTLLEVASPGFFALFPDSTRVVGLKSHADVMWASISVVILLAMIPRLRPWVRLLGWLCLLSSIWWIVYVETRAAWAGLAFALPVLGWLLARYRLLLPGHVRILVALGGLCLLAGLVSVVLYPAYVDSKVAELMSLAGKGRGGNIRVRWLMWEDIWNELAVSPWLMLFGVGFGKPFLHRFSEIFTSPTYGPLGGGSIFSPHNSQWLLVYRIGFVGFLVYLTLIGRVLRDGLRALRSCDREQGLVIAALISCFVYAFVHSLTDVVLENPQRGVIYWSLLGLCQAAALIALRDSTPRLSRRTTS